MHIEDVAKFSLLPAHAQRDWIRICPNKDRTLMAQLLAEAATECLSVRNSNGRLMGAVHPGCGEDLLYDRLGTIDPYADTNFYTDACNLHTSFISLLGDKCLDLQILTPHCSKVVVDRALKFEANTLITANFSADSRFIYLLCEELEEQEYSVHDQLVGLLLERSYGIPRELCSIYDLPYSTKRALPSRNDGLLDLALSFERKHLRRTA